MVELRRFCNKKMNEKAFLQAKESGRNKEMVVKTGCGR